MCFLCCILNNLIRETAAKLVSHTAYYFSPEAKETPCSANSINTEINLFICFIYENMAAEMNGCNKFKIASAYGKESYSFHDVFSKCYPRSMWGGVNIFTTVHKIVSYFCESIFRYNGELFFTNSLEALLFE